MALEKKTWFHFRWMKISLLFFFFLFFFFCCRPSTSWPVVYKSLERKKPSIISENDTMFNERDRKCAAVQLMPSTDPSYDNRTITSTLKMQIWRVQHAQGDKNKVPAMVTVFGVVSSEGHIMPLHIFEVGLKATPKCTWMYWRVCWSPGAIRWPVADSGYGSRTQRRPTSPKRPRLGFRRSDTTLYPYLTWPRPPRLEPAGLLRLVIRREHHQHDLPQHQSQPDRRHPPSIRRAPASTSLSKHFWILELCTKQCFFKYGNPYKKQRCGPPMGSPLSDVQAFFYLEFLESQPFKHTLPEDIQYFRYIDDTLIIYPKEHNIPQMAQK